MKLLVTGGAGFIGSAFVRLAAGSAGHRVTVLDKLTYAGNLENLEPVAAADGYEFVRGDIGDAELAGRLMGDGGFDAVVHFAAESHVDRSILSPRPVFDTNLGGSFTLLEAARQHKIRRYVHVSTDEVYGSLEEPLEADESFPLKTSSPYSAAKAGSDLLTLSYFTTYKLPVIVTRASNNYGPYQFPEKLIPLMIANAFEDKALPVYGDGRQVRDWLYVDDHCRAILALLDGGREGQIYNIGGNCSLPNIDVIHRILKITGKPESLITTVADRPGHDRRYALRSDKLIAETGWAPQMDFDRGLQATVDWYAGNPGWVSRVRSGAYRDFYDRNYGNRS